MYFVLRSMLMIICYVKTFAKVGYQKGFDKKQLIKRVLIPKLRTNNQNTN